MKKKAEIDVAATTSVRRIPMSVDALPTQPDDSRLDHWYHTIELGNGLISRGIYDHRSVVGYYGFPDSLHGKTCLDVATANGFFAFEMERRGAARVVAIDAPSLSDLDLLPRVRANGAATSRDARARAAAVSDPARLPHVEGRTGPVQRVRPLA